MADDSDALQILLARLRDTEAVIAAVKLQRWDVVKWVITVNFGLTTALIAIGRAPVAFVVLSLLAVAMGIALVWHYNRRATEAREVMTSIRVYINDNFFDLTTALGRKRVTKKSTTYDATELLLFSLCMGTSVLMPLAVGLTMPLMR